jgi:hypothetical protein
VHATVVGAPPSIDHAHWLAPVSVAETVSEAVPAPGSDAGDALKLRMSTGAAGAAGWFSESVPEAVPPGPTALSVNEYGLLPALPFGSRVKSLVNVPSLHGTDPEPMSGVLFIVQVLAPVTVPCTVKEPPLADRLAGEEVIRVTATGPAGWPITSVPVVEPPGPTAFSLNENDFVPPEVFAGTVNDLLNVPAEHDPDFVPRFGALVSLQVFAWATVPRIVTLPPAAVSDVGLALITTSGTDAPDCLTCTVRVADLLPFVAFRVSVNVRPVPLVFAGTVTVSANDVVHAAVFGNPEIAGCERNVQDAAWLSDALTVTFVALLPLTELCEAVNELIFGAAAAAEAGAETATVKISAASAATRAVRISASLHVSKAGLTLAIN